MATKLESDIPSSPPNEESDADEEEPVNSNEGKTASNNVADILKRLQSSGALLKKPKQEYRCYTCDEDFPDWEELETHLIQHVSLPSVVVDKLPSDDEYAPLSGEDWSDDEDGVPPPQTQKTPQKIDISQLMKKTGISIKTPVKSSNTADSALNKLSGLGFTITKNSTPIKEEKVEQEKQNPSDVMQKLGKLGGIKLKLKSDGGDSNSFKVINGLRDFKTSDDEDDGDNDKQGDSDPDDEKIEKDDNDDFSDEQETTEAAKQSDEEEEEPLENKKVANTIKNVMKPQSAQKPMPKLIKAEPAKPQTQVIQAKAPGRPAVKQTPRRGANLTMVAKPVTQETSQPVSSTQDKDIPTSSSTPERRESSHDTIAEAVAVKQEVDAGNESQSSLPLFAGKIKTERSSPTPTDNTPTSTPIIAKVKSESEVSTTAGFTPLFQNNVTPTTPLLPVTKTEDSSMTIIEINGDSNDEDDDCCVVSATPAPDVKPIIPKPEAVPASYPPPPAYSTSQTGYTPSTPTVLSARLTAPSTEKQHSFNWNAPDSKPPLDMLQKSADDIFDSLISTKRETSFSDASEYISLDTLGPQHSCEVCNTRFTSLSLLDDHKRVTGHSSSLVPSSMSSTLLPYTPSSSLLSSLLPVKQLAEQVGKLSTIGGSGSGFTHQQNVMINIQAYPGAGGVMGPPQQPYNAYQQGQGMHSGYQQPPNSMYDVPGQMPGQQMPGQYPGQYMGQQYGQQYQPQMSKPGYPGAMPSTSTYSTSPLQGMQQAVYGQNPGMMNNHMSQMGPPGSSPNHPYVPASSPSGIMKPPTSSSIRIQNVQTFTPGQIIGGNNQQTSGEMGPPGHVGPGQMIAPGQQIGNQMPTPGPIRMAAGANITGSRPRMQNVRGIRPSIRPGIQVHQGQGRGAKPRMPMKRPGGVAGGPGQKRRTDMLLPGKHDNDDCQVMAMQKQREGLPMIHSVQGAKDKLNLGSQISITKKTVNKEANAMANVLASRGISVKQKQKSRSPSPERPIPHIPNLGAGVSIKHTSKSSNFSIPEAKVGGGMQACKVCKKMFMNSNSLAVHMSSAHPQSKLNMFKCDECPASYPKSLQLQHHKRVFHNVSGPNRELGLPVVDLAQEDTIKRLSSLGIYSFIPLANREQASGCFGIPVISVTNMQNGMTSGLQALGADGLLSLGPLKPLPNT